MDNVNLLTSTDADGGLPASPPIRFNKEGILLAVSTNDNGLRIGTFGSSNITVGTGIGDRVTPMPAMVGLKIPRIPTHQFIKKKAENSVKVQTIVGISIPVAALDLDNEDTTKEE
ncbi:topless-related protein 4-like isoform X2 [Rosa chinensis]|nr:topless-related protein 4-like isoform X2 [Rosa chinensis]